MVWLQLITQGPSSVTPLDSATDSLIGEICSYGLLGILTLALCFLFYRGWRLVPPDFESRIRDAARMDARADLIAERDRVLTEKQAAEDQRDEALTVARDQVAPLLASFVATTSALVPILQEIIRNSPRRRRGDDG